MTKKEEIYETIVRLSSELNYEVKEAAIILAAGHGKRIKSQKSNRGPAKSQGKDD